MSVGQTLLNLQELDLSLMRDREALADMPELKELAKKRKLYLKLKGDMTKLYAQRKDLDIELEDLDFEEAETRQAVTDAQSERIDVSDYRQVQDLEIELSSLAKQLDKIAFARKEVEAAHKEAVAKERAAQDYLARLEAVIVAETKAARTRATELQDAITAGETSRAKLIADLPEHLVADYDRANKRFKGLAVESLSGSVPSVCRTTLQESSLSDLKHAGEITHCPYCHRILVRLPEEEEL